jgi:hypothetical protein
MQVLSPVGTFPLRFTGVHIKQRIPVIDTAMGAWRSELRLDRHDLPLAAAAVGVISTAFLLGRVCMRRR